MKQVGWPSFIPSSSFGYFLWVSIILDLYLFGFIHLELFLNNIHSQPHLFPSAVRPVDGVTTEQ